MTTRIFAAGLLALASATAGHAATLIDGSTMGYYNSGIGTVLDGTSSMFPPADVSGGDPTQTIPASTPPDLSAADAALGNWLTTPGTPGGSWSPSPVAIPASWAINTETAIIYELDGGAGGLSNVVASFGVDNGLFAWLNGTFLGGYMSPGGVIPGEITLALGNLSAGLNYLQILREDHGGDAGYSVSVTGDVNPAPVPLPASGLLLAGAAALLAGLRRRKTT